MKLRCRRSAANSFPSTLHTRPATRGLSLRASSARLAHAYADLAEKPAKPYPLFFFHFRRRFFPALRRSVATASTALHHLRQVPFPTLTLPHASAFLTRPQPVSIHFRFDHSLFHHHVAFHIITHASSGPPPPAHHRPYRDSHLQTTKQLPAPSSSFDCSLDLHHHTSSVLNLRSVSGLFPALHYTASLNQTRFLGLPLLKSIQGDYLYIAPLHVSSRR
ncbi:predicted protein [Plenodomus lingam JN3]|uniref:Predicted protein n=2 Tax=Leptosphaeria maculans TaxID=5022 RepID=E4ZSW3_LEPMJ|nr:predicted protein [Plenodomus lingam JN3]CBX94551.1 predicted protein [Plenodomus lingam JN3]